jgi:hypothetical protein
MTNRTIVNIPDPNNKGCRIVGFRLEQGDEALGQHGVSEPLEWFNGLLSSGIKSHDGQKLLVKHILDSENNLSESSRMILKMFIGEDE